MFVPMNDALSNFSQSSGVPAWVPLAALIVVGVLLWGAGKRGLKLGLASIGFGVGAAMGYAMGDSINLGLAPWMSAALAGLVCAIIAAVMYRLLLIVLLIAVGAAAAPMTVLSLSHLQTQGGRDSSLAIPDAIVKQHEDQLQDAAEAMDSMRAEWLLKIGLNDRGHARLDRLESSLYRAQEHADEFWRKTPQKLRPTLMLAGVIGAVIGLFLGIMAPSFGALALTAFAGSLMWITGTRIVATKLGLPEGPWLPAPGTHGVAFASMWLITSLVGMGVQSYFLGSPKENADKPA